MAGTFFLDFGKEIISNDEGTQMYRSVEIFNFMNCFKRVEHSLCGISTIFTLKKFFEHFNFAAKAKMKSDWIDGHSPYSAFTCTYVVESDDVTT